MELIERNANIYINYFKRIVCVVLQSLFQIFKNWLKRISALTAHVCGAAPCSALPTADENAVTESTVTTISSSLFLRIKLSLAVWNLQATRVSNFLSCNGVVITAVLKGGRTYASSTSVCWCQEVFWGHGWDVALHNLVEGCQPLLLPTFLQWWQV